MSTLEIITIALMALFGILGCLSGIIKKVGGLLAVFAGIVVTYFLAAPLNNYLCNSSFYNNTMLGWFGNNETTAQICSLIVLCLVIFIVVYIAVRLLFRAIKKLSETIAIFGVLDKILGFVFGVFFGLVLGSVILLIIAYISQATGSTDWINQELDYSFGLLEWMNDFFIPEALNLFS